MFILLHNVCHEVKQGALILTYILYADIIIAVKADLGDPDNVQCEQIF